MQPSESAEFVLSPVPPGRNGLMTALVAAAPSLPKDIADLGDVDALYAAVCSRDSRFAGRFYVGVRTTGIYCRPGCPAKIPRRENIVFYRSAAAAQEAGFRACLRCRPETLPGTPAWRGTSATVGRAVKRILATAGRENADGHGTADPAPASVMALAERAGVGPRHLRRLFVAHVGASPSRVARARRLDLAEDMIRNTSKSMADIAFESGFASVRRFNEAIREAFGKAPGELRREAKEPAGETTSKASRVLHPDGLSLRLSYRPPFDAAALFAFLAARAVEGVELVGSAEDHEGDPDHLYRRTFELPNRSGTVGVLEVTHEAARRALRVRLLHPRVAEPVELASRVERLFDLKANPARIAERLGSDPLLGALVAGRPGLRVPGAWDPFELAVRAVLGQVVSVRMARTFANRFVATFGRALPKECRVDGALTHLFPNPQDLAGVEASRVAAIGIPKSRAGAILAIAEAARSGLLRFGPEARLETIVERLVQLPGVGPWTAQYIAMRAYGEPDAFPSGDLVVQQVLGRERKEKTRVSAAEAEQRAEPWRPFRAYATLHLWMASAP